MSLWRTILVYGALFAIGAFGLHWLEWRFMIRAHAVDVYVALVAVAFLAVGVWVGVRIFRRPAPVAFEPNTQAQASLDISGRELEVLQLLAAGLSNKEIAQRLDVSPNTIKTHVGRLFEKLAVRRRTAAIQRARELGIIA